MKEIFTSIIYLWKNFSLKDLLDIFIVSLLNLGVIYFVLRTYKWKIFFLILVLLSLYYLINFLNLTLSLLYFSYFLSFGVLIILIIFQKEIRKFVENLDISFIRKNRVLRDEIVTEEIIKALDYFSQNKLGCLIVFKNKNELKDKVHNGIVLHSHISAELLISIFQKNSPLHDGAVIIDGDKIKLAAAVLPLSDKILKNVPMGTRHRAGLGITEESDAFSIIVSEETGELSYAKNGGIKFNVSYDFVRDKLLNYYSTNGFREKTFFKRIIDFQTLTSSLIIAIIFSLFLWTLVNYPKIKIQKITYFPVNFKKLKENYSISYITSDRIQ